MEYILRSHEIYPEGGRKQLAVALWKNETNVLTMVYDVLLHTARLESNGARRLFMVYEEGKRHPKTVFKNEYGFNVGVITPMIAENGYGNIELYEKFYAYNFTGSSNGLLSVYSNPHKTPLISFEMEVSAVNTIASSGNTTNRLPADYFNCLLMGICWYLQLPVKVNELVSTSLLVKDTHAVHI